MLGKAFGEKGSETQGTVELEYEPAVLSVDLLVGRLMPVEQQICASPCSSDTKKWPPPDAQDPAGSLGEEFPH